MEKKLSINGKEFKIAVDWTESYSEPTGSAYKPTVHRATLYGSEDSELRHLEFTNANITEAIHELESVANDYAKFPYQAEQEMLTKLGFK